MISFVKSFFFISGWANTLVGGQRTGAKGFAFFSVTVDLSEKGQGLRHCHHTVVLIDV